MTIPISVFLDTNVLLDDILSRDGAGSAKTILQLGVDKDIRICLSILSTVNIAYVARKAVPHEKLVEVFDQYLKHFVLLPNSDSDVYAYVHGGRNPDYEDAMQIACAESNCDVIVTHNKKHFAPYTDMPVLTPEEFLDRILE